VQVSSGVPGCRLCRGSGVQGFRLSRGSGVYGFRLSRGAGIQGFRGSSCVGVQVEQRCRSADCVEYRRYGGSGMQAVWGAVCRLGPEAELCILGWVPPFPELICINRKVTPVPAV